MFTLENWSIQHIGRREYIQGVITYENGVEDSIRFEVYDLDLENEKVAGLDGEYLRLGKRYE